MPDRDSRQNPQPGAVQAPTLDPEEIALRAYQLYVERGGADGHDVEDWVRAEQELARDKQQKSNRPKLSKSQAA